MERSIKTSPYYCYAHVHCHCQQSLHSYMPQDNYHIAIGGTDSLSYRLNDYRLNDNNELDMFLVKWLVKKSIFYPESTVEKAPMTSTEHPLWVEWDLSVSSPNVSTLKWYQPLAGICWDLPECHILFSMIREWLSYVQSYFLK